MNSYKWFILSEVNQAFCSAVTISVKLSKPWIIKREIKDGLTKNIKKIRWFTMEWPSWKLNENGIFFFFVTTKVFYKLYFTVLCNFFIYHYKFVTNATLIMYAQVLYVTLSAGFFLFFIFNQEGIDSFWW